MSRPQVLSVVWLFACSLVLSAQTPDTATIHGRVVDQSHAAVAGVEVAVTNSQTGLKRTAQTESSGDFSITGLPVSGSYTISASKQGFATASLDRVEVSGGGSADVSLQLNVASGQSQVTVTGAVGEVRTDQPQLGQLLDTHQMDATPLLGNRITYLPMLNAANRPAINQGDVFLNENLFTTNGAGRREAWFEVDGSTGNDSWGRQTIFSNLPRTALEEMSVLTNAFSAEYGGSTGSVINIVTKSGGNQFHGELMELWRPSAPEAAPSGFPSTNAATGNALTNDSSGQSDISLGGPLNSSHTTHFFVAGEFSRERRSEEHTS